MHRLALLCIPLLAFILVYEVDQVAENFDWHDVCPEVRRTEQLLDLLMKSLPVTVETTHHPTTDR